MKNLLIFWCHRKAGFLFFFLGGGGGHFLVLGLYLKVKVKDGNILGGC